MSERTLSIKTRLIRLQNLLTSDSPPEPTSQALQELLPYFATADLTDEPVARGQVYDELRDTVKAVFGYLERVKSAVGEVGKVIEGQIKQLLLGICGFCSAFYHQYLPLGCGEMIRDFLSSECRLFVLETLPQQQPSDWIWARSCAFKTVFFCSCVQVIMGKLASMEGRFEEMRVTVIGQYLRLLHYMDDYIIKEKLEHLVVGHVLALEKLFNSPGKETVREVSKDAVEEVMDYLLRLLRNVKGDDLRRRVQLLGPSLAMSMIKLPSIEKKLVGSRILNRFSCDMLYKNNSYLTEQSYAEWLIAQGFFQAVFEDHCQSSIVKLSDDSFKFLVKRGYIDKPKFQRFFQVLEKADAELRRALFRLIDPFRVDYYQIQAINQILALARPVEFYDDQFFYFYQGISRYSTQNQLNGMLTTVQAILSRHYAAFPTYLTRRRAVECYAYIFQKLVIIRELPDRLAAYLRVAQQFLEDLTESRLIMLKTLFNNLTESKLPLRQQEELVVGVVDQMKFLQRSLPAANNPALKEDLLYFLRSLLAKYSAADARNGFGRDDLVAAVGCSEVFEEMLRAIRAGELQGLLEALAALSKQKDFAFSCIKWVFIHFNRACLRPIKKEYADVIATYATVDSPSRFRGVDVLMQLLWSSEREGIRRGACDLLAEIATNFASDFRAEGEVYLPTQLEHYDRIITEKVEAFLEGKGTLAAVQGALELAEALMLATEYFGVGQLRAHNSHVPSSTVWLRVYNNCGLGDDTQKIFQKRFPSNRTLFEVIREVAAQFKVGPLDIGLEFPNIQIIRFHGLTLQQLKLNGQELNAVKLPQSRSKPEPMTTNGELTPKAKIVFTEIFNKFAVGGYMGPKECANYVNGVTLTYCPLNDSRVTDLFARYDTDKDEKITVEDFLKFYRDCIDDPNKVENVQKNLYNLHYRSDLLPYDGEITCDPKLLFRHYAAANTSLYDRLFVLTSHSHSSLAHQARTILLRLPTSPAIISSLTTAFDLRGRNSFETEYLLTALQSHLSAKEEAAEGLIAKGNHLSIFEYLGELAGKQERGTGERNCLVICLHVLRSLLGSFSLRETPTTAPRLAFALPSTPVFINIIRESVQRSDSTLLEPALALQLTQEELPLALVQEAAFSKDKDTRILTCNFLRVWLLAGKGEDLNLFKVSINPQNNQEWFSLLALLTRLRPNLDPDLFGNHLRTLNSSGESLEGERFNPLLFGILTLMKEIYSRLSLTQKKELNQCLGVLLPRLISNQNRSLVYDLRAEFPQALLGDLERTVRVEMSREGGLRNRFVGIRNLGCICYMNSILQQFFMIKQFTRLALSLPASRQESTVAGVKLVDDFLAQLQQMYVSLEWSQKQYYDPTPFCLAVKDPQGNPINTHIQQDAHEFLNSAFDKMENYCKKEARVGELQRLFGGKTVTEIICQTCKNKNEVLEHFYHLSVEVKGMKSLKESFDKLIQIQEISDYFCEDCGKKVEKITKQMLIKEAPEILIINLQRIIFDLQTFLKVKVHTRLQFDQTLDLRSYYSASAHPAPYTLKGVVIHAGTSEGGHYYSLIKHQDRWYKFNDQSVTPFSESEIGRQAFGGEDVTDHWGEHTSSTNAYILFYERARENEEEGQTQSNVCGELVDKVKQENLKFMGQMQYNQPSFFNALHQLFIKYSNPFQPENRNTLTRIGSIYRQTFSHLSINSDVKTQIITQIRDNLLSIFSLLPECAVDTLQEYKQDHYKEAILNFADVNVRDIYAKVLSKAIKVTQSLPQHQNQASLVFQGVLKWISQDVLLKNIHKSYQYFEMLKELLEEVVELKQEAFLGGFLVQLLDLLMGGDSILASKDKKRPELHSSEALPVVKIISFLVSCKLQDIKTFSDQETRVLREPSFYRRMIKSKIGAQLATGIIEVLAKGDAEYSKMITEVLLRAMNSNQIDDKNTVIEIISVFLKISDEFQQERFKWVLGIPQLQTISYTKQEFGLSTSAESLVYTYVSSLLFIKDDKYQPFLFTLFEKRKYFNSFSALGTLALLKLSIECPAVLNYILSLPSPTYVNKSYFGWIKVFAHRIKNEQHYGLPMEKQVLYQKISTLLQQLTEKLKDHPKAALLPVNKLIIGKNAQIYLTESLILENIRVEMYTHLTYVLPNLPEGHGNTSLPSQEFSFASTREPHTAKFFLQGVQVDFQEEVKVEQRLSMITFSIHTQTPCSLKINIPDFQHRIYLKPGTHSINAPYSQGSLQELLQVVMSKQKQNANVQEKEEMVVQPLPSIMNSSMDTIPTPSSNYFMEILEIECKACTYLNIGRQKCQMCDGDLLS